MTAMSVGILYVSAWLPRGKLALAAAASLLVAAVLMECGTVWAIGHYIATFVLALLLLPDKLPVLWYGLVFGHYGIVKHYIERISQVALQWCFKLLVCYGAMAALYFLFSEMFLLPSISGYLLIPALGIVFVFYDIAFTRLIGLYLRRVHRTIQS